MCWCAAGARANAQIHHETKKKRIAFEWTHSVCVNGGDAQPGQVAGDKEETEREKVNQEEKKGGREEKKSAELKIPLHF